MFAVKSTGFIVPGTNEYYTQAEAAAAGKDVYIPLMLLHVDMIAEPIRGEFVKWLKAGLPMSSPEGRRWFGM